MPFNFFEPLFSIAIFPGYLRYSPLNPQFPQPPLGPLCPLALLTVALPLANPTPLPLVPLDLNIGAFRNISGTMKNLT